MRRAAFAAFVVMLLAVACSTAQAPAVDGAADTTGPAPRPDVLPTVASGAQLAVGVNAHLLWSELRPRDRERILDALAGAGVRWLRVDVGWASVQEEGRDTAAQWYLDRLDATVDGARERGMKVWAMLWSTPAWARDGGDLTTPPEDHADYAAAAALLASRYAGRVSVWELWNEANTQGFFAGSPADYAALFRAGAAAVRAADPAAWVSTAGTSLADPGWLDAVLDDLGGDAARLVDVVSVHPYPVPADAAPAITTDPAGGNLGGLDRTREVLLEHGLYVPVVVGELGWSTHPNAADTPQESRGVTGDEQAAYLAAALQLVASRFPYVAAVFVYDDRDTDTDDAHQANFGLLTRDLEPKAALSVLGATG